TFTQMNQAMKEVSGETFVRSNSFFKLNLGIARFLIRQITSCFKLLEKLNRFLERCLQWMNQAVTGDPLAYLPKTKNPGFQSFFGDLIAYYNPDVIHVHDLPMLPAGLYAKQKLRRFGRWVPVVYDAHEFYPEQPRLNLKHQQYLRKLEANYIGKADVAFTVNPLLAKEMERHYPGVSIGVVQNAINPTSGFDPSYKYNRFREEYHLPEDAILVLYQGWIAPGRNLEIIIEGMVLVPESSPFHLLLMGYGDYIETLQALVTRLELSHRVHFIPSQPQETLLYYSASADVGLIPYPYHQDINTHLVSPNKLYEFIIAGLPILSNELPFVKQLIETHGFGMCFDIQTPQGFANALEHYPLARIQEFKGQLQNGYKVFLWETEAEQLLSYYHQLDQVNMRTLSS
ncbi:MAG: glycosyltransferase, partial [Cyanobacteria bacterium]|nr:glycosyltransferase [Cyanobacteriota bacterium]